MDFESSGTTSKLQKSRNCCSCRRENNRRCMDDNRNGDSKFTEEEKRNLVVREYTSEEIEKNKKSVCE